MDVESVKQEIADLVATKESLIADLDTQKNTLINILKPFISTELQKIIEEEVKKNPSHTKSLGIEKLSDMKKRLNNLLVSSDSLVNKTFSDNQFWIHVNYKIIEERDSFGQRYNNKKTATNKIIEGIKIVFGKAGEILVDYGYDKTGSDRTSRWQTSVNSEIVFGSNHGFYIPEHIDHEIKKYSESISPLHDTIDKLNKLDKKFNQQEALDLWEQA
uniref:hypothetical protein n=1 Tax=Clostridium sp. 12(A) TaxID=1163671 RepID=UPI0004633454|nr:hypothetical protein [Clostridium sp. 12(A)]